ncbi:hypothetical protein KVR01_013175 [Diaporthe batatas]|uniref:uncharacterized protein n=1 Tax=Diaporthe batatas TaxID=748121 RepID=UPI001D0437E9|nr:uncharacterized protein KVR01_013175 [Diaporthe batatas]KAG8156953.1 hypothetical protein KVR01_013175 [Diaporthe batatas]
MALRPGEENVATLFGDVHYFYGPPTDSPPHHRFDKGSYVYLFENANEGRARIEVANHVGTDDQDAFDGFLDKVHVTYSYRQHCMVNLAVGDVEGHDEWHLPTYDPHNQNKYHYKLHSLDIYFWTQHDALSFVNGIRRVLPPNQVDVQDEPGPPSRAEQRHHHQQHSHSHAADVNPLVQKLENAAIFSDASKIPPPPPQQPNGGRGSSTSNTNIPSFAPPPLSALPNNDDGNDTPPESTTSPASFAPMAYNPAAPAAPEQIRHREKTPPPEDGDVNPLHARLAQDAGTPFSPGLVSGMPAHMHMTSSPLSPGVPPPQFGAGPPGAPSFPGPPVASPGLPPQGFGVGGGVGGVGGVGHPHPGLARAATMPAHAHGMPSPALQSPYGAGPSQFPGSPGFAAPHQQQQPHGTSTPTPPPPPPPGAPPPGGFSNYTYATQQGGGHGAGGGGEYGIHQQAYRPTEGEVAARGYKAAKKEREPRGRLEENAGRLERGVTGMFKKFEKKFG